MCMLVPGLSWQAPIISPSSRFTCMRWVRRWPVRTLAAHWRWNQAVGTAATGLRVRLWLAARTRSAARWHGRRRGGCCCRWGQTALVLGVYTCHHGSDHLAWRVAWRGLLDRPSLVVVMALVHGKQLDACPKFHASNLMLQMTKDALDNLQALVAECGMTQQEQAELMAQVGHSAGHDPGSHACTLCASMAHGM